MNKWRVFKEGLEFFPCRYYILDVNLKFKDIQNNVDTALLTKESYIGTFYFDYEFLKTLKKSKINDYEYFVIEIEK